MFWILIILAYFTDLAVRIMGGFGSYSPDLLLLALVYITLTRPLGEAYCLAFIIGFCWDAVFLDQLGLHAFLFVLAVMFTARLGKIFWAQYAISRLVMGFLICALTRFGEVMYWLSSLDHDIPVTMPEHYILYGSIVTGVIFLFTPLRTQPIDLPRRSPQTIFADRG